MSLSSDFGGESDHSAKGNGGTNTKEITDSCEHTRSTTCPNSTVSGLGNEITSTFAQPGPKGCQIEIGKSLLGRAGRENFPVLKQYRLIR